eukprot:6470330-Alexandrium_andersonii.AAC.1
MWGAAKFTTMVISRFNAPMKMLCLMLCLCRGPCHVVPPSRAALTTPPRHHQNHHLRNRD